MPDANPSQLPFKEAIEYFSQKIGIDTDSYIEGQGIIQQAAFTVAAAKGALLQDIREAVAKAIDQGISIADFAKEFDKVADRYSANWELKGDRAWRSQLIYEQNLRQANAAGRYAQMTEPETLKRRPFWIWRHGGSRDPRPVHLALDNRVFKADSLPFFPPSGFQCFPSGTMVACDGYWSAIELVQEGGKVLGGSGYVRNCLQTHSSPYDGELISVHIGKERFCSTPNHQILTTKGWIEASRLKVGDIVIEFVKIPAFDDLIGDVDKTNACGTNFGMPSHIKFSAKVKTFNPQRHFVDFKVNPVGLAHKVMNDLVPATFQRLFQDTFTLCRQRLSVGMDFRPFSIGLPLLYRIGFPHSWVKERRRFLKFLSSVRTAWADFFGFTKIRMVFPFSVFRYLPKSARGKLSSGWISFILQSDRLAYAFPDAVEINKLRNESIRDVPSRGKSSHGHLSSNVKLVQSLFDGAPLQGFDSLDDFNTWATSHCQLSSVTSVAIVQYKGTVYNLTVEKDSSYLVPGAIVHNCACQIHSLSQRDVDREGLEVEELTLGQEIQHDGRTLLLEPDPGFNWKPGNLTADRRAEILGNLAPDLQRQVEEEYLKTSKTKKL